jgi:hypothetical protein
MAFQMTLGELLREYARAAILAEIFGERFWKWEQKRTRLFDQIENEFPGGVSPANKTEKTQTTKEQTK